MDSSVFQLTDRSVLCLEGPDTIALLERLVTNDTRDWEPGAARYGGLLTPQGKVIADFLAVRTPDGVWLDVAKAYIEDLAKRLKMFRLRSQVEIEIRSDLVVFASAAVDASAPDGAALTYLDPRYPDGRMRAFATDGDISGAHPDLKAYHADRIAHGLAEQGIDFGAAEVFPSDINMDVLGGVALNKGCFVGQEVVSRMHRRGKIRKRTLRVILPETASGVAGDPLTAPAPIGKLTSVAGQRGLALLRVDRLLQAEQAGEPVQLNESSVTIEKPDWLVTEVAAIDES